jgi:hypothetical protein
MSVAEVTEAERIGKSMRPTVHARCGGARNIATSPQLIRKRGGQSALGAPPAPSRFSFELLLIGCWIGI